MEASVEKKSIFNRYDVFVITILSLLQFTVILDFMVLSPLGAILIPELKITTSQFGMVVSAYAFSAGISGIMAAGFADRFDRKAFLLFFYAGFMIGTMLCALATTYEFLLIARIVTGIFGGVIGSVGFAIVTDLFKFEVRGRVMGFMQMSFAASQVLGLPIGLLLANRFDWHAPFWMLVILGLVLGAIIVIWMKPVTAHLALNPDKHPYHHLVSTLTVPTYAKVFLCTTLLATGGFMMMPFGSAFGTNNLGLKLDELPLLYGVVGICSILMGPYMGKLSDKVGKLRIFVVGTLLSIVTVAFMTRQEITPFWVAAGVYSAMFVGISARMISSSALVSAIPNMVDRGAFMSINASVQQLSGGVAAAAAGLIVYQSPTGHLERYDMLGNVVIATMVITIFMMWWVNKQVVRLRG